MDEAVIQALARWPNVPAVYGWLSLDRRGHWRLQGEPVRHAGLAAFISRNYAATENGEWFFQNGPQRVFVSLEYTPWVLRWSADDRLTCHTGDAVAEPSAAWLDDRGSMLIGFEAGVGLVCDQDLPALLERFSASSRPGGGDSDPSCAIEHFLADPAGNSLWLHLATGPLPIRVIQAGEVPTRFGFDPEPQPRESGEVE